MAAACWANEPAARLRSVMSRATTEAPVIDFPSTIGQIVSETSIGVWPFLRWTISYWLTFSPCETFSKSEVASGVRAVIEEHRDRRAQSFFGRVAVDAASAAVPTHNHAFGGYADDGVARDVDDALQC